MLLQDTTGDAGGGALATTLVVLAKAFGRGWGTALLLVFLTPIGFLVLGFGDDAYALEPDPLFG